MTTKFPETGKILSGIADAYIGYFVNHHTGLSAMPENVTYTFTDYDYIENAELMDNYTKKMSDYVSDMLSSMDSFRAENGYSYADMEAKYEKSPRKISRSCLRSSCTTRPPGTRLSSCRNWKKKKRGIRRQTRIRRKM